MSDMPPGLGDPNSWAQTLAALAAQNASPSAVGSLLTQLYPAQLQEPLAQQQYDVGLANQQYGDTMAALGIQGGTLQREQTYLPEQQALAKQLLGLSGQELGIQGQRLGLQGQSLDITQTQEQEAAQQALRGAQSSATARGAINTSGYGQQRTDIGQNLANQLAQLALSRKGIGLSGQELGIQGQRLGIEGQQQDISNVLQSGALADQLAQLGLSRTEAQQALNNAIGQANINAQTGITNTGINQLTNLSNLAGQIPTQVTGPAGGVAGATPPGATPAGGFSVSIGPNGNYVNGKPQ